ncbi:MAG: hypothetical protein F4227_08655 [Gammaproteobacteria bacterium]|nr:hypothetical protein [Gammaproteobacteria bacterium]MYF03019.1 hypothetical protein [Gammaproteobacteria bacterium]MYI77214.1 hypothetical protein [Gammaproteobacteria bacterium]
MKKLSAINGVGVILALAISGQLFAEKQIELDTKAVKTETAKELNSLSSPKEKGRDYLAFVSAGFSGFQEDIDASVGGGSNFRLAGGTQYNEWFGIECYVERTPAIAPSAVLDDFKKHIDQRILHSSISSRGNVYGGILGKFSYDIRPTSSLFAKVGVAKYYAHQVTAELTLDDPADNVLFSYVRLEGDAEGYSPVVSIGYEAPIPYPDSKKTSAELSLTQMFDDKVKHLSLNVLIKFTF